MYIEESKSGFQKFISSIKKSWHWVWNSDSVWSWVVALIIIYIFIKFIFFPFLSLITGTILPLAGVESSSMDHQIVNDDYGTLSICGNIYTNENKFRTNFEKYWELCGDWYEEKNITKEQFKKFSLSNGFKKGDIVVVWGRFTPKIGDVIIFKPNPESQAPRPIVHRIISIETDSEGKIILQTKGDHNGAQLTKDNNMYHTDETSITEEQIIGKVVFKIPYLGWFKIWLVDFFKMIF